MMHLEEFILNKEVDKLRYWFDNILIEQKIDGKFMVVFGLDEYLRPFVTTKSYFNKINKKICYTEYDITKNFYYSHVVTCLKSLLKCAKNLTHQRNNIYTADVLIQDKEILLNGNILNYDLWDKDIKVTYNLFVHSVNPLLQTIDNNGEDIIIWNTEPNIFNSDLSEKLNKINREIPVLDKSSIVDITSYFNKLLKNNLFIQDVINSKQLIHYYIEFINKHPSDDEVIALIKMGEIITIKNNLLKEIENKEQFITRNCITKNFPKYGEGFVLTFKDKQCKLVNRDIFSYNNFLQHGEIING